LGVKPEATPTSRLSEFLTFAATEQGNSHAKGFFASLSPNVVDTSNDVAPLVTPSDLNGAVLATLLSWLGQSVEIVGLEHLVAEFCIANATIVVLVLHS
jgi:hypothetical protein